MMMLIMMMMMIVVEAILSDFKVEDESKGEL